jgi:hypothetical protein
MTIIRSSPFALLLLPALALALGGTLGCGSDAASTGGGAGSGSSGDDLKGTVSFNGGPTLECDVDDQDFAASGEYSITCDNDEVDSNYRFVQITFKDEASARTAQTLKFMRPFAFKPEDHPDADAIAVSWTDKDGTLDSDDDSTGTAKVVKSGNHYTVTLTDVSVESTPTKATGKVTAVVNF